MNQQARLHIAFVSPLANLEKKVGLPKKYTQCGFV
jgi:hypothetical protein